MRRESRGAGWARPRRGISGRTGEQLEFVAADSSFSKRGGEAVDQRLVTRFAQCLTEPGGRLRPSIRIPSRGGTDWIVEYLSVLDVLGAEGPLIAAWWLGVAQPASRLLGEPRGEVPLESGSDLDLVAWGVVREELGEVLRAVCELPTVLSTIEPGWLLVAPPSSDDMFLYPEVSASD